MSVNVIALSGSLRKESYTTRLLKAFGSSAPGEVNFKLLNIGNLPMINQDLEDALPSAVQELHQSIEQADAFLFGTPEYNRSYSPVIKNAIDWGSRPEGRNAWNGKPGAIVGCSPYTLGAFGAVHHLRQVLTYVNVPTLQQPEFYLSNAADMMDDAGKITDQKTQQLMQDFWAAFVELIGRYKK